jgi:SOS-response transcriptional repressor LexA
MVQCIHKNNEWNSRVSQKNHSSLEVHPSLVGLNLNRNLSRLMDDNNISLTGLHRNTGIAIPTIKRLQSDPTTNPTMTTLIPIADFFGLTVNQLISNELNLNTPMGCIENKSGWLNVPIIEWSQAINWPHLLEGKKANSYTLVDVDVGENPYALSVEEDDWLSVPKSSILIINANIVPENKDHAVVYKAGQNAPTLRQVIIDEEKIYLKALSPYLPPIPFEDIYRFLGVVIQIRKNIKV